MKKILSNIYNHSFQNYAAAALLFSGVFLFLIYTGTLTSGYHFIDDHAMIGIDSALRSESFLKTSTAYIKSDLNIRFRPVYYLYYISEVRIFGLDFLALSIFTGLLAFVSFFLFYIGMRKLGHSFLKSLIFVLLIFIGPQSAIWWRLGTNETVGMFFLGLAFLFMTKCLDKSKYTINNVLFVVFLTIASLCKESFVIIIPAFVLFKIWNEKIYFHISFKESVKKNTLLIFLIIVMIAELWTIKYVVGTNKIGYAGMTSSVGEFIAGVKNIFLDTNSLFNWINLLRILVPVYLISFLFVKEWKREFFQSLNVLFPYMLFSLLIVLPNIFMHAKSGMIERYLLPTTLGLAFLAIGFWQNARRLFFKSIILLAIIFFIINSFNLAREKAGIFAYEGQKTNELLSAITMHSKPDSKILLVVDSLMRYEVSWSLKVYLSSKGIDGLFGYPMPRGYDTDLDRKHQQQWLDWFKDRNFENMNGRPDVIVFIDKIQSNQFFDQSGIPQPQYYNILDVGCPHAVYVKNILHE
jgi:hypothetical protein